MTARPLRSMPAVAAGAATLVHAQWSGAATAPRAHAATPFMRGMAADAATGRTAAPQVGGALLVAGPAGLLRSTRGQR